MADSEVRGTDEQRLQEIRDRLAGTTAAPWFVWDGVQYMGGGRDLCIGSGPTWLANMDHRQCGRREVHMEGWGRCGPEQDSDICSIDAEISAEQEANANFIARAREDIPFLLALLELKDKTIDDLHDERRKMRGLP